MDNHIRLLSVIPRRVPSQNIEVREHFLVWLKKTRRINQNPDKRRRERGRERELTELLLLLEEGPIEGFRGRIEQKLEAVEDLDSSASLDADHASVNPRVRLQHCFAVVLGGADWRRRVELSLNPGVVIRYVDDY